MGVRGFENANSMMPYYYSESIVLKDRKKRRQYLENTPS
jgi:hypothetical protein